MAEWKKIIVSGSDISQLNNDSGYLIVTDTIDSASVAARATTLSPEATASIADFATTASHAVSAATSSFAVTASHALNVPDTASFALNADSASVAARATLLSTDATASFADLAGVARNANSASVAARATELSADATASFADLASVARNADSASVAARATTLSPEATASIADLATTASFADLAGDARTADSASVAARATELSVDATASFADLAGDARTADSASVAARATTLSTDATASFALLAGSARNADSASVAARATTLSADATASYADLASVASSSLSASVAARATELSADATASYADSATTASFANLAGNARNADSASVAARATTLSPEATASIADLATTASHAVSAATASHALDIQDNIVTTDKIVDSNVTNIKLANDSVMVGSTNIELGATASSLSGLSSISATTGSFVLQIFESSSVIITSGSNIFGDQESDVQQFTGSILTTGSIRVTGSVYSSEEIVSDKFSGSFSGSFQGDGSNLTGIATVLTVDGDSGTEDVDLLLDDLQILGTSNEITTAVTKVGTDVKVTVGLPDSIIVTASLASNAESASVAARATLLSTDATASFALLAGSARNADSASVAARATELSADATASHALTAVTASHALNVPATASHALTAVTASIADELSQLATASFADLAGNARNADSASVAARATELSADATASFADSATSASIADELSQLATASIADTATSASQAENATSASATFGGVLFPLTDGLVNQALVTDGAGQLDWGDIFGTGSTKKLNQSVAASTWSFAHNLNELYPIVQVYDSTGDQLIPDRIVSVDVNNVEIYFADDTAGVAAAMVGGMGISASNATTAQSASVAARATTLSSDATASFADRATTASIADELSQLATASIANLATTASHALSGAGSFSGSFQGDGSGLTGLPTNFNFDGDTGATTVDLLNSTASFNGTAGEIETSVTANTLTIGLPNNVTIGNNLTITNDAFVGGDLTVGGAIVSASSLAVEDQFIILASGSNGAIDGGIIVNQIDDHPDGKGVAFAYDSSANRWALETGLNDTASVITPDAYMGVIQENNGAPVSDPIYGGTAGKGTIFIDTSNDEAYIYI